MKRLMTATVIATVAATGAMAQTEAEEVTIKKYLPNVNVETLTNEQVEQMLLIANGSESVSEKEGAMRAFVTEANMIPVDGVVFVPVEGLTEAERTELALYAPELDISTLTDEELVQLRLAINSDDTSEIEAVVDSIEDD